MRTLETTVGGVVGVVASNGVGDANDGMVEILSGAEAQALAEAGFSVEEIAGAAGDVVDAVGDLLGL